MVSVLVAVAASAVVGGSAVAAAQSDRAHLYLLSDSAVAATSASAVVARSREHAEPIGAVADCSTRSGARFPGAFTHPNNLVVGPLAMIGAGGAPLFSPVFGGNKFPLLVKAGHRVTIELSARTRKTAGLAYGPLPQGEVHLRDAHRIVTFIACPRGEPSGSSTDGQAVTFWSGGVLATSAQCVPLQVWVDDAPQPRRVVLHLGTRRCGSRDVSSAN
jgi:hypothetical protein